VEEYFLAIAPICGGLHLGYLLGATYGSEKRKIGSDNPYGKYGNARQRVAGGHP